MDDRGSLSAGRDASRVSTGSRWRRASPTGIVLAVLFLALSLTPLLLPLPWLMQALAGGVCAAAGYGIGALIEWIVTRVLRRRVRLGRTWWIVLGVAASCVVVGAVVVGESWQDELRSQMSTAPFTVVEGALVVLVSLLLAVGIVALARAIRHLGSWVGRLLGRRLSPGIAGPLGGAVTAVALLLLFAGVLKLGMVGVTSIYADANAGTDPGVNAPTASTRSGSPESLVPWQTIGRQGQNFVSRGPSQQQLADFNGGTPVEPIRIYVGLDSASTPQERAALAVQELERTDAFARKILVVVTPTGTGWIEPQSADPLEYMYNGDSALVAQQYSFFPSWISTLVDKDNATDAGRALFSAVYEHWSQLPPTSRPQLIAYGLSLGSFGQQAAFADAEDLAARTQGALFMGTPNFSEPWGDIVQQRDPGSPEVLPVYQGGETVRFADAPTDTTLTSGSWAVPRVLYLQHATDPVVWWSPGLLWSPPDWLREPRGRGVSSHTLWFPLTTFAQASVGLFIGTSYPNGFGHNYGNMTAHAWAAVAPSPGWDAQRTDQLQRIVDAMPIE